MKDITDQQRRFAELVVQGHPAGRAYELAGYSARGASADCCAAKLQRNAKVAELIEQLRGEAREEAKFGREELIAFCVGVVTAKPSEAGPDNPLCEVKMSKAGPYYGFPSKIAAAERLAKMLGLDKPVEVNIGLEAALTELFATIRKKA